jgi:HEAT repeat protein
MSSLKEYAEQLSAFDQAERIYAAEDIGYLNDPDGVPVLLEALGKETSRAVRDVIFQALIRIDSEAAIEGSIRLLGNEDPQIRNQAVDVLRNKGSQSIPFLSSAMRDGDKNIRKLVLDVLSGIRAGGTEEIYSAALSDRDQNIVITAVENLGKIRAEEFRSRIEDLLQPGAHPMLISACLEALAEIGNESSMASIRGCMHKFATLPDFQFSSYLKAIGALGSATEFSEVECMLGVCGSHFRPAILSTLVAIHPRCPSIDVSESLMSQLRMIVESRDPPKCRYQAVRVLGIWSSRNDVFAILISCLSSTERLIRLAAAEAIGMSERPEVERVLATRVREETDGEVLEALNC